MAAKRRHSPVFWMRLQPADSVSKNSHEITGCLERVFTASSFSIFRSLLLVTCLSSCDKAPPEPPRARPQTPASAAPRASGVAPGKPAYVRPAAVASALAEIHERLPLAAPAPRLRHLA